jgi:hypothetical protein
LTTPLMFGHLRLVPETPLPPLPIATNKMTSPHSWSAFVNPTSVEG